jgi:hypothetical protein
LLFAVEKRTEIQLESFLSYPHPLVSFFLPFEPFIPLSRSLLSLLKEKKELHFYPSDGVVTNTELPLVEIPVLRQREDNTICTHCQITRIHVYGR